jgi:hypothetical protein
LTPAPREGYNFAAMSPAKSEAKRRLPLKRTEARKISMVEIFLLMRYNNLGTRHLA